jgi:hypothetical protein
MVHHLRETWRIDIGLNIERDEGQQNDANERKFLKLIFEKSLRAHPAPWN